MKKYIKSYMIRPILYKSITKFFVCFTLCLLWDRFLNQEKLYTIWEYPFFLAGCILLSGVWFCYLKLDHFTIHHLAERKERPPRKHHAAKSIVDFADEKILSFDELNPQEQTICNLLSNLITGTLFLLPALILLLF